MESPTSEPFYADIQKLLDQDRAAARELLLRRIVERPADLRSRLLLAKAFFLDGMMEYSIRELIEVRRRRDTPSIQALIASFGPLASQYAIQPETHEDKTVSEIDFDLSVLDEIEE